MKSRETQSRDYRFREKPYEGNTRSKTFQVPLEVFLTDLWNFSGTLLILSSYSSGVFPQLFYCYFTFTAPKSVKTSMNNIVSHYLLHYAKSYKAIKALKPEMMKGKLGRKIL